ncbi:hypothetical protein N301_03334, partial [Charadrius vociferus]
SNSKNKIIQVFWVSIRSPASSEAATFLPYHGFQPSA